MKRFIACVLSVLMLMSFSVISYAADENIITFDQITGTLTVSDNNVANVFEGDIVTMVILKPGYNFADLEDGTKTLSDSTFAIKQTTITKSGSKGTYTFGDWTLPSATSIGNYSVRIGIDSGYLIDGSFYFITVDLLRAEVNEVNNASASQMAAQLSDKAELFSLDLTDYNALSSKDSVNSKMAEEDFSVTEDASSDDINVTVEKIKSKLNEFVAVAALDEADDEEDVETCFTKYAELYGIDLSEETAYGKLTANAKARVKTRMAEDTFAELADVSEKFDAHCVLVKFESGSYGDVASLISNNNDILEFDLTAYNDLTKQEKTYVHKKMVENSPVYKTVLEAKAAFDVAVSEAPGQSGNEGESESPSSGSSSGRGSGSGKTVGLPAPNIKDSKTEEVISKEYFTDTSTVLWAKESIDALYEAGVVSGKADGIFAPNDNVTRAEFIKMLTEAILTVDNNAKSAFTDVNAADWFYKYAATCQQSGLVLGYEDGSLKPNSFITRQEMAVMVKRFLNYKGIALTAGNANVFKDSAEIGDYANAAAGELYASGIMSGDENGNFMPTANTTRAQAAKVIYMAMQLSK